MPSVFQQILWLLKKAGKSSKDYAAYCIDNPGETGGDIWDWIKRNKLTCFLIASGTLVIVVPLAIGFGPAGPIAGSIAAGWQAGIGNVVAGSVFATLQSLTMTGVLTGICGWMIGGGVLRFLMSFDWVSSIAKLVRRGLGESKKSSQRAIDSAISRFHEAKRAPDIAISASSISETEIPQLLKDLQEASEVLATLELTESELDSLHFNLDDAVDGMSEDAGSEKSITDPYSRRCDLEKQLDAALATATPASDIRQLIKEMREVDSEITALEQTGVSPVSDGLGKSEKDESNKSKRKPSDIPATSSPTQLLEDLQQAKDEIAVLKLALAKSSRPSPFDDKECSNRSGSTSASSPGSAHAPPSTVDIDPPRCQQDGYDTVAAEYKGRLKENRGLRTRLRREGRCFRCRQLGAPHSY